MNQFNEISLANLAQQIVKQQQQIRLRDKYLKVIEKDQAAKLSGNSIYSLIGTIN